MIERWALFNVVKRINGSKVSRGKTGGPRALYRFCSFLTIRKC